MSAEPPVDGLKRKIRKLKRLEKTIRFGGGDPAEKPLVWDGFFDLRGTPDGNAKYNLRTLASMSREEYASAVNEFFARVYYEFYRENGITSGARAYDPEALSRLGLTFDAGEADVKKKFRELAKEHHPDAGGDAAKFVELMRNYRKLTGEL